MKHTHWKKQIHIQLCSQNMLGQSRFTFWVFPEFFFPTTGDIHKQSQLQFWQWSSFVWRPGYYLTEDLTTILCPVRIFTYFPSSRQFQFLCTLLLLSWCRLISPWSHLHACLFIPVELEPHTFSSGSPCLESWVVISTAQIGFADLLAHNLTSRLHIANH